MMNKSETAVVEEIQLLDEIINEDENFDIRFGIKLVAKATELWRWKILKKLDEQPNI